MRVRWGTLAAAAAAVLFHVADHAVHFLESSTF
jgi:hypothetical protein